MTSANSELQRLARVLIWRGVALVVLAIGALAWPEPFLVSAMLIVGVVAVLFGIYEITIALSVRGEGPMWRVLLTHGLVFLAFGLMTVGAPTLPFAFALAVIATWLFLYAGVVFAGAAFVWPMRSIRWFLILWGAFDIAVAGLAIAYPLGTMLALLGFGAIYAALFGVCQLSLGLWLRHRLHSPAGLFVRHMPA